MINSGGKPAARGPHALKCAERLRVRLLLEAGEPAEPPISLLHTVAARIESCCGHTSLKSHRLAWGWTVDQAIKAFHEMCRNKGLGARGLTERSWLGWEAGGRPNDDYRDLLCRLFHTSGVRLGFAPDYTPDEARNPGCLHREVVPSEVSRQAVLPEPRRPGWLYETGDLADRRQVLRAAGGGAAALVAAGGLARAAVEAMEFTRRAEWTEVGPRTLEHLELAIAGMAAVFPCTPPADMFPQALWYRRHVGELIEQRRYTLREGRDLYCCAGWLSIILGWLSHDLGNAVTGEAYCLDAWEHGWQAEHGEVCAWAMDAAATIAMYSNRPQAAHDAALRGLDQAPASSPAAVRVSCQLARAAARLGQRERFDNTLRETRERLDHLPALGGGLFSADAGRIASYAATSAIWLGQPQQAVAHARDAIAFYEEAPAEQRSPTREAISRLDLGLALVALGTPDAATAEATQALGSERVTGSVLSRAGELDNALRQRFSSFRGTAEFHERYRALAAGAGLPQLTAQ